MTLVFTLGTLILAGVMAALTLGFARNYLLQVRESSARHQTFANAELARSELRSSKADVTTFLGSLPSGSDSDALVYHGGKWFGTSVALGPSQLPGELLAKVLDGAPATQRFRVGGATSIAVAVPIPAVDAVYIQVYSLRELNSTLRIMSASLAVAATVTTIAGAMLGRWASKRALQPVRDVAAAAGEIAGGKLDTRLRAAEDPDLASLAAAFNAMVDALQTRLARDARFASDVSHELRSPLTTLATSLSVLERNNDGWTSPQQQALGLIRTELTAFQRLVADLLEISRVDAGATALVLDDVPAGEFLAHVGASACPDVPVDLAAGAAAMIIRIDKRRLERVLANLIENAGRYGGGVVRLGLGEADAGVRFVVDDAGPGVPPADRDQIFERFSRGSGGRRTSGTGVGLGLALVTEHVALHGGRVWVEDRPGGGARFVVELPEAGP